MSIQVFKKEDQATGNFNNGAILENKPIGFPRDGGRLEPYSNLFYWAHAWTPSEESVIELHPHKGFEIVSIILKGAIEHYDSGSSSWNELKEGSAQIIRSGSGISHSEKILKDSAIFQIWLDPDLTRTLSQPATYNDYPAEDFPLVEEDGIVSKRYAGIEAPMQLDTENIAIWEMTFDQGTYVLPLNTEDIYSSYLLSGTLEIDGNPIEEGGFSITQEQSEVEIKSTGNSKLFIIKSPLKVNYKTYSNGLKVF